MRKNSLQEIKENIVYVKEKNGKLILFVLLGIIAVCTAIAILVTVLRKKEEEEDEAVYYGDGEYDDIYGDFDIPDFEDFDN